MTILERLLSIFRPSAVREASTDGLLRAMLTVECDDLVERIRHAEKDHGARSHLRKELIRKKAELIKMELG